MQTLAKAGRRPAAILSALEARSTPALDADVLVPELGVLGDELLHQAPAFLRMQVDELDAGAQRRSSGPRKVVLSPITTRGMP